MRRIVPTLTASLGIACAAPAQFIQFDGGYNDARITDAAATYDINNIYTYLEQQQIEVQVALGVQDQQATSPWSATYLNGAASGNGETALTQGSLVNGAAGATFSTFLASNSHLDTTLTGFGPYYGVLGISLAAADTQLDFTVIQATTMTTIGSLASNGGVGLLFVDLFDETSGTDTHILGQMNGGAAINFSQDLVVGDSYRFQEELEVFGRYQFDSTFSQNVTGPFAGSGALATSFGSPAPEPITCLLLGSGVMSLLSRKKRPS